MEGREVVVVNQPLLPHQFRLLRLKTYCQTAEAIKTMIIRGAGTIGATGAYGLAQAHLEGADLNNAYRTLLEKRPTAADLKHALDRVRADVDHAVEVAEAIANEYAERGCRIGEVRSEEHTSE